MARKKAHRVRLEGDGHGCQVEPGRPVPDPGDEPLVSDVDAIEIADGDAGPPFQASGPAGPCDALHAYPPANDWASRLSQKVRSFNRRR